MENLQSLYQKFHKRYEKGAPEIFLGAILRHRIGIELGIKDPEGIETGKAFEDFPEFIPLSPFHSRFSISLAFEINEVSREVPLEPHHIYSLYLRLKGKERTKLPPKWPPDETDHLQIFDLLSLSFYLGNEKGKTWLITNSIVDYYFASLFSIFLELKEKRYFLYDPVSGGILESAMGVGIRNAPAYSSLFERPRKIEAKKVAILLTPQKMKAYRRRMARQVISELIYSFLPLKGNFVLYIPEHYFFGPNGLLMNSSLLDGTHLKYTCVKRIGSYLRVEGSREKEGSSEILVGSERIRLERGTLVPKERKYRKLIGRGAYSPVLGAILGNSASYLVIKLEDLGNLILACSTYLLGDRESFFLEKELYMPCIRSQEVEPWKSIPRMGAVVPFKDGDLISLSEMLEKYPNCAKYFISRYHLLISRKGASFRKIDPWRNYSDPIEAIEELKDSVTPFYFFPHRKEHFSRYKVFWKYSSREFYASTYLEEPVLPISGTVFIKADSEEEATYLLSFLNSKQVREVSKYLPSTNSPKVLERIKIPKYDPSVPEMKELSSLGKKIYIGKGEKGEVDEVMDQLIDLGLF